MAPVLRWRWQMALAAGSAVIVMAAVLTMGNRTAEPEVLNSEVLGPEVLGAGVLGAGVLELTDMADDPSLSLLADLTESLDWDAATEAGFSVGMGAADRVADDLNESESTELRRLLNDALAGTPIGSTAAPVAPTDMPGSFNRVIV